MPINKKQVTKRLRLSDIDDTYSKLKPAQKAEVKERVGDYLTEKINEYLDKSNTPVSGGSFKSSLSKEYKKKTGKTKSDLFLEGDMRSQLAFEIYRDGVEVGIFNEEEAPKAYNHNVGDTLPQRQFIPDKDQTFKKPILDGIKRIIREVDGQE